MLRRRHMLPYLRHYAASAVFRHLLDYTNGALVAITEELPPRFDAPAFALIRRY